MSKTTHSRLALALISPSAEHHRRSSPSRHAQDPEHQHHRFGTGSRALPGQRLSRTLASSSLRRRLLRPRQVRRSSTRVTSSQQSHTQHAGCRSAGPRCGLSRLRLYTAQVRRPGDLTSSSAAHASARSARALTQGACRTGQPTALRRELRRSTCQVSFKRNAARARLLTTFHARRP